MSLLCVCEKMVCTLYFKRTKYPEALLRSTNLLANISKSKRNTFPSDSKYKSKKSNNNIGWAYSHSEEPKSWPVEFGDKTFQGSLLLGEWTHTLWSVVYVCNKTWDSKSLFFYEMNISAYYVVVLFVNRCCSCCCYSIHLVSCVTPLSRFLKSSIAATVVGGPKTFGRTKKINYRGSLNQTTWGTNKIREAEGGRKLNIHI